MVSRAQRTVLGEWWWTVDRWLIAAIGLLMICGIVFGLAASPAVAEKLGLQTFHFVNRQAVFLLLSCAVLVGASFLSPRQVRRLALLLFAVCLVMIFATLIVGQEIKGARRWLSLAGITVQPSEFIKPAFVIMAAWAFAEGTRRKDMPATILAILMLPALIVPLALQPDVGQTMLISGVWCGLFFIAGLHWFWVAGLGGLGAAGVLAAYKFAPHVRTRVDKFLAGSEGGGQGSFQVDTAIDSITGGGWFGKGPGEGTIKRILPDSHTDFIFAVTAEEFGIIVCMALACIFAFAVLRALMVARSNDDAFCRLAGAGLAMLFGFQACINMAVNLNLMPPKGMTLPFVSYGGSSMISLALGMGFLIALTRKRPRSLVIDPIVPVLRAVPA